MSAAEQAVRYVVGRLKADPRLAFMMGPGSESFDLLTAAMAEMDGHDLVLYREVLADGLKYQPVHRIGSQVPEIDEELMIRMSLANENVLDLDDLVNHFIGLGLQAYEAERDPQSEELF